MPTRLNTKLKAMQMITTCFNFHMFCFNCGHDVDNFTGLAFVTGTAEELTNRNQEEILKFEQAVNFSSTCLACNTFYRFTLKSSRFDRAVYYRTINDYTLKFEKIFYPDD